MKVKINSQKRNPLFNRAEIVFEVKHEGIVGTPSRVEVRKNLAAVLNSDRDRVYIQKMETKTGTLTTNGSANVYDTREQAKLLESEHIIKRNTPPETLEGEGSTNE